MCHVVSCFPVVMDNEHAITPFTSRNPNVTALLMLIVTVIRFQFQLPVLYTMI